MFQLHLRKSIILLPWNAYFRTLLLSWYSFYLLKVHLFSQLQSFFIHFLGDPIRSHNFKYHPYANNSQIDSPGQFSPLNSRLMYLSSGQPLHVNVSVTLNIAYSKLTFWFSPPNSPPHTVFPSQWKTLTSSLIGLFLSLATLNLLTNVVNSIFRNESNSDLSALHHQC